MDSSYKMYFEICGERYELSDYYSAIDCHKEQLKSVFSVLTEFPYSVKSLSGDAIELIKNTPVSIIYKAREESIYDFLNNNRKFAKQLPKSEETNCLERKHDLELAFMHFKQNDDYHSVIYETFRVLQDFHFLSTTARWALIQAHRILHYRSELQWENGWEQLWARATWLNNAIIMYDSCFDKLTQAIWIGTETFESLKGYSRASLSNVEELEEIYIDCWRRHKLEEIPQPFKELIINFRKTNSGKSVSDYAQKIKHRGGMRYEGLFPFGDSDTTGINGYNPSLTRNTIDIDKTIETAKEYQIGICCLAKNITSSLMEVFRERGYLTEGDIAQ